MTSEQHLTLFDMAFLNCQLWEEGGMRTTHHNFVVIASMVTKFTTDIKLDLLYTTVREDLLCHYFYVIMMS